MAQAAHQALLAQMGRELALEKAHQSPASSDHAHLFSTHINGANASRIQPPRATSRSSSRARSEGGTVEPNGSGSQRWPSAGAPLAEPSHARWNMDKKVYLATAGGGKVAVARPEAVEEGPVVSASPSSASHVPASFLSSLKEKARNKRSGIARSAPSSRSSSASEATENEPPRAIVEEAAGGSAPPAGDGRRAGDVASMIAQRKAMVLRRTSSSGALAKAAPPPAADSEPPLPQVRPSDTGQAMEEGDAVSPVMTRGSALQYARAQRRQSRATSAQLTRAEDSPTTEEVLSASTPPGALLLASPPVAEAGVEGASGSPPANAPLPPPSHRRAGSSAAGGDGGGGIAAVIGGVRRAVALSATIGGSGEKAVLPLAPSLPCVPPLPTSLSPRVEAAVSTLHLHDLIDLEEADNAVLGDLDDTLNDRLQLNSSWMPLAAPPAEEEDEGNTRRELGFASPAAAFATGGDVTEALDPLAPMVDLPRTPVGTALVLTVHSTWGDPAWVGLQGLQVIDTRGRLVSAPVSVTGGPSLASIKCEALDSSLEDASSLSHTRSERAAGREGSRDPAGLVTGACLTTDPTAAWTAPWPSGLLHPSVSLTLTFTQPVEIALVRVWNYNRSRPHSYAGVRLVSLLLDGVLLFRGECRKAPGHVRATQALTPLASCSETLLFSDDVDVVAVVSAGDPHGYLVTSPGEGLFEGYMASAGAAGEEDSIALETSVRPSTSEGIRRRAQALLSPTHGMWASMAEDAEEEEAPVEQEQTGVESLAPHPAGVPAVSDEEILTALDAMGSVRVDDSVTLGETVLQGVLAPWAATAGTGLSSFDNGTLPNGGVAAVFGASSFALNAAAPDKMWDVDAALAEIEGRGQSEWHGDEEELLAAALADSLDEAGGRGQLAVSHGPHTHASPTSPLPEPTVRPRALASPDKRASASGRTPGRLGMTLPLFTLPRGRYLTLRILSTWGDPHYVGLSGIAVHVAVPASAGSDRGVVEELPLATDALFAVPDCVGPDDPRTLDKLVDGVNAGTDDTHMWLVPFTTPVGWLPEVPPPETESGGEVEDEEGECGLGRGVHEAAAVAADAVAYGRAHATTFYPGSATSAAARGAHLLQVDLGCVRSIAGLRVWNYNKSAEDTLRGVRHVIVEVDGKPVRMGEEAMGGGAALPVRKGAPLVAFGREYAVLSLRPAPGTASWDYGQYIDLGLSGGQPRLVGYGTCGSGCEVAVLETLPALLPSPSTLRPSRPLQPTQDWETATLPIGSLLRFVFPHTAGDPHYIGLDALALYDAAGRRVRVPPWAVHASRPSSINDLSRPGQARDPRVPSNLAWDGVHPDAGLLSSGGPLPEDSEPVWRGDDPDLYVGTGWGSAAPFPPARSWLAPYAPADPDAPGGPTAGGAEVVFALDTPTALSLIRLFNYSKSPTRGAGSVAVWLDGACIFSGELEVGHAGGPLSPLPGGGPSAGLRPRPCSSIAFTSDPRLIGSDVACAAFGNSGKREQHVLCYDEGRLVAGGGMGSGGNKGGGKAPTARPTTALGR